MLQLISGICGIVFVEIVVLAGIWIVVDLFLVAADVPRPKASLIGLGMALLAGMGLFYPLYQSVFG